MTPEERAVRFLARIKELDDPQRPTPYALHAMITREVEEAIAEEREACAQIGDQNAARFAAQRAAHERDHEEAWWRARMVEAQDYAAAIRARRR